MQHQNDVIVVSLVNKLWFRRCQRLFSILAVSLLIAACAREEQTVENLSAPISLSVMSFNIEWGGANICFDNVVDRLADEQPHVGLVLRGGRQ